MDLIYRVEINYYFNENNDCACFVSSPYNTFEEAAGAYEKAIQEYCIDNKTEHARCELSCYFWKDRNSKGEKHTLIKNY